MSLLDQAEGISSPGAAAWVRSADRRLRDVDVRTDAFESVAFDQRDVIGKLELERLLAPDTPPFGVYGAGLFRIGRARSFVPALFVRPELVGLAREAGIGVFGSARDTPARTFATRLGLHLPPEAVVVALPPPTEHGVRVKCDMLGTLGAPVTLADGRNGILTAGHVAKTIGAQPTVQSQPIGVVAHSNHRALHRSPDASADVAAIALSDEGLRLVGPSRFRRLGTAARLRRVRALNYSGTGGGGQVVRALSDRFAVDELGEWADVATVDEAISIDGDSGSAVIDEDDALIGQIVGGHPFAYSLVQNIDLLLGDSGTSVRFGT